MPGRAETLDYDPRWRARVDHFCPCDAIPLPDRALDFALASHVLEHLPNPAAALSEWRRLLKAEGRLLLFMPDCRLYVPDRQRAGLRAGRLAGGDGGGRARRAPAGVRNSSDDPRHDREMPRAWSRASRHHWVWRSAAARALLERLGFVVELELESPGRLVAAFEERVLPRYSRRRFIERSDCEPLERDLLALQQAEGAPLLDYSFILVARPA